MKSRYLFTSESVSEGHPDKMADQISDAILDEYLKEDLDSKVACECLLTEKRVIVAGEIHSKSKLKSRIPDLIRQVIRDIGYDYNSGYDPDELRIFNYLHEQSPEIRHGVESGGAGDQGLMFGYACNETPIMMPYAINLAHRIMEKQSELRKSGRIPWLLPDAKSQVTVIYEKGIITGIDNIVVSTQHMPYINAQENFWSSGAHPHGHYSGLKAITNKMIQDTVINEIVKPLLNESFDNSGIRYFINPSGSFEKGGPATDTGLTGRKIIVDTYGGSCPHGGGAFSGKDSTKVDRSGAYIARYIAKNIVASKVADKCLVQLAFAIGRAQPVSFMVDFIGTGKIPENIVKEFIENRIDLTPKGIIERLNLRQPIFRKTASYGHFGRELTEFLWERTDLSDELSRL